MPCSELGVALRSGKQSHRFLVIDELHISIEDDLRTFLHQYVSQSVGWSFLTLAVWWTMLGMQSIFDESCHSVLHSQVLWSIVLRVLRKVLSDENSFVSAIEERISETETLLTLSLAESDKRSLCVCLFHSSLVCIIYVMHQTYPMLPIRLSFSDVTALENSMLLLESLNMDCLTDCLSIFAYLQSKNIFVRIHDGETQCDINQNQQALLRDLDGSKQILSRLCFKTKNTFSVGPAVDGSSQTLSSAKLSAPLRQRRDKERREALLRRIFKIKPQAKESPLTTMATVDGQLETVIAPAQQVVHPAASPMSAPISRKALRSSAVSGMTSPRSYDRTVSSIDQGQQVHLPDSQSLFQIDSTSEFEFDSLETIEWELAQVLQGSTASNSIPSSQPKPRNKRKLESVSHDGPQVPKRTVAKQQARKQTKGASATAAAAAAAVESIPSQSPKEMQSIEDIERELAELFGSI